MIDTKPLCSPRSASELLDKPCTTMARVALDPEDSRATRSRLGVEPSEWACLDALTDAAEAIIARYRAEVGEEHIDSLWTSLHHTLGSEVLASFPDEAGPDLYLVYVAQRENPALAPAHPLIAGTALDDLARFEEALRTSRDHFEARPALVGQDQPLLDFILAPARVSPHSLRGQVDFVLEHWTPYLDEGLQKRLLQVLDIIDDAAPRSEPGEHHEVHVPDFSHHGDGDGDGASGGYHDEDQFSSDRTWMPEVVLVAKNAYVWLDQLSQRFSREIHRLDQIPDEVLDELAEWGLTSLWLIGVWQRSTASRDIKRRMGNPEAEASAYSIYDHEIASQLGGEEALWNLKRRAAERGIRLAADMVPNHTGVDSRWVKEHPDWFVQTDWPPFDGYRFDGPNLSSDEHFNVHIEDGYWNHSDAAVVFKRVDNHTGQARYIYHGNDGTHMPWNDTAQLDFRNAEVRKAVIDTIVAVARRFPVIRFDAAMTLTKMHFQRLWFPEPGSGSAIPSRAWFGMSKEDLDQAIPVEFWREVVDTVAEQVPDTLLLAEAFWMTESFFVRTLGMHRVYNSAFMNMLKDEANERYRQYVKDILSFNPEVMRRYVNFMSNPDEETAIEQFGVHDKYFGVCTLMVTMPGLPMFAHGQLEGLTEKYGMEYRKAYRQEERNEGLVDRHRWEVFPLMRRRALFAGVEHFALFDFCIDGGVDENVFAYTNRHGSERAVVFYNNSLERSQGHIQHSVATKDHPDGLSLIEALGIAPGQAEVRFRELRSKREWVCQVDDLRSGGIQIEIDGYEAIVLLSEPVQ